MEVTRRARHPRPAVRRAGQRNSRLLDIGDEPHGEGEATGRKSNINGRRGEREALLKRGRNGTIRQSQIKT